MHGKRALFLTLLVFLLLIVMCPAGAAPPIGPFTGNSDTDFAGKPGVTAAPDIYGDGDVNNEAGCEDGPLNRNSFINGQNMIPVTLPPASGFNIEQVYWVYDCADDTLYVGLDVCDTPGSSGVAWDAGTDKNIVSNPEPSPVPGFSLVPPFSDRAQESYLLVLDVNNANLPVTGPFAADFSVRIFSNDGGANVEVPEVQVLTPTPDPPTVTAYATGADVEVKIKGIRKAYPFAGSNLPVRLITSSGAVLDNSNEDLTDSLINLACQPCISITKTVSCLPDAGFGPSVTALRGSDVYFKIDVTNCATGPSAEPLKDVVLTDLLDEQSGDPLLNCAGCTLDGLPIAQCIPGVVPIGNIAVGQTRTLICKFPTNPNFNVMNREIDATNTASVTGAGAISGSPVNAGPVSALVNVIVPSLTCTKLADDDPSFAVDPTEDGSPGKLTPSDNLNVRGDGIPNDEPVWYYLSVTNNGEVPIDFGNRASTDPNCPGFHDDFIKPGGTPEPGGIGAIPGTDENLDAMFDARLQALFGRLYLLPGEKVEVVVGDPTKGDNDSVGVVFREGTICPVAATQPYPLYREWVDHFTACGFATCYDATSNPIPGTRCGTLCLPAAGGEWVDTECSAKVTICPGDICIDKYVSCLPNDPNPTLTSIDVVRGTTIYFYLKVTNCGGENLRDVVVTDELVEGAGNPLLNCTGCTLDGAPIAQCLPGVIPIGNMAVGQTKTIVCAVPTNPAFSLLNTSTDATNCAFVTAIGIDTGTPLRDPAQGSDCVTVDVRVPGIACDKLVDDDSNPNPSAVGDLTPPTEHLDLRDNAVDTEKAWYYYRVDNTGDIALDFNVPTGGNCPTFADDFIKPGGTTVVVPPTNVNYLIPGTNQDLYAKLRAAILVKYPASNGSIPAGGFVDFISTEVTFDEATLCRVLAGPPPPGRTAWNIWPDTVSVCGIGRENGVCGSENVDTECSADVTICPPCGIEVTKEVSCLPDSGFGSSADALRGAEIYFKIVIRNTGGENLTGVTVTDTLVEAAGDPLLNCAGCTLDGAPIPDCIPGVINIGDLYVGQSKTLVCKFPTNPAFNVTGNSVDVTNSAFVAGTCMNTQTVVNDTSDNVTVDVLVPSIACDKLVDDDNNPVPGDGTDTTPPTGDLNLTGDGALNDEPVWYYFSVTNNGEVPLDFGNRASSDPNCPGFHDDFIKPGGTPEPGGVGAIPGTDENLDAMFDARLQALFGRLFLLPGETAFVVVGDPTKGDNDSEGVVFRETVICPEAAEQPWPLYREWVDHFTACGFATCYDSTSNPDPKTRCGRLCLPAGGGEWMDTECSAKVTICGDCIEIDKGVSCEPGGPFVDHIDVIRGTPVYFQIVVTNCGGLTLTDIEVTDVFQSNGACCPAGPCIPGTIPVPDLAPGETWSHVYTVPTNPAFATQNTAEDCRNTASVTARGLESGREVGDGPAVATVNVLVPDISIEKLVDDDANPMPSEPGDPTPPVKHLNLIDSSVDIETAWYYAKVTNLGETELSFACTDQDCLALKDNFIKPGGTTVNIPGEGLYLIPGTDQDLCALFLAALQTKYGSLVMPAGGFVELAIPDPVQFDEEKLCKLRATWPDILKTCATAEGPEICGSEQVRDEDNASVAICEPVLYQAYPGDSNETNNHYGGYLGEWGDTITSVPGVFKLVPGDNWANFVTAAQQGIPYQLKNVTLIKQTPKFIQCDDVFIERTIAQQGTNNIRLRWPLMYEAPGTTWTLTVAYGTNFPWDDDGAGPHVPGYYHENKWMWKVDATLESLKHLLALLHEVPFATDEVPLISDEVMYPILQAKLDNIIALYYGNDLLGASTALGEFEMDVMDACITVSPREPNPTGPGTGIANSDENPACCKILVDAEYIGFKYGFYQVAK